MDDCIDTMLAGPKPADLVSALALPVPSLVICEQLGVPYEGHAFFQTRSHMLLLRGASAAERLRALDELIAFLGDLISEKEAEPTDDLLGRQIVKLREAGTYRHEDLARMAFLLLVAGHETTANMISLGTMALLDRPEDADACARIRAGFRPRWKNSCGTSPSPSSFPHAWRPRTWSWAAA